MKYRIKNEAVEKAVRGLFKTQEAYEEALNNSCRIKVPYAEDRLICVHGHVSVTGSYCDVHVAVSNIEEVVEYDPLEWNQWPQVRPIKKGNYRIEHDENGYTYRFGFYWNGHFWEGRKGYGPICSNSFQDGFRFKPWDDEGDEE